MNLPMPVEQNSSLEEDDTPLPFAFTGEEPSFYEVQQVYQARKTRKGVKREKIAQHYDDAFDLIGGVPRLALWANGDPEAFYKLHAKLIPSETKTQFDGTIRVIGFVQPTALDGSIIEGEVDAQD